MKKSFDRGEGVFVKIHDAVFGELEYDFVWRTNRIMEFCGKEVHVVLMMDGDEDGEFGEKQYAAFKTLKEKRGEIQQNLLQPIVEYYKRKRFKLVGIYAAL